VSENEAELVQGCIRGEEDSIRRFVQLFQNSLFGLCFRMLGHRQDAEDVVQDVFLRAFRSLHQWDSSRPLNPWLFTIAVNCCRTALTNRSKREKNLEFTENWQDLRPVSDPDGWAEELQQGVDKLREEYRICFTLFYVQELSCEEIGRIMGCPEGTVKTWLFRARKELAAYLKKRGYLPTDPQNPN